jgi:hypothetical protein
MTESTRDGATRGGLVFRVGERRWFLPAEIALKVAPRPQIARIPGAPPGLLGVALSDGTILPVVELAPDHESMVVCLHRGEHIGLLGATSIESGVFPANDADGVLVKGAAIPPLDLDELYGRLHVRGTGWGS